MLHVTSWMQKLSKSGKRPKNNLDDYDDKEPISQQSFMYDHYLNKYDYHYSSYYDPEELKSLGYWGYLRDKNADSRRPHALEDDNGGKVASILSATNDFGEYDSSGFWGQFEDPNLKSTAKQLTKANQQRSEAKDDDGADESEEQITSRNKKLFYDLKCSKFKIQAFKRDESKNLFDKLQEIESNYKKECVKLFDLNDCDDKFRINLIHFNSTSSINRSNTKLDLSKLINLKNMLNVLTRLNSTINLFTGDSSSSTLEYSNSNGNNNNKFAKLFSELNIHACMNGLNDLRNNYYDKYFAPCETTRKLDRVYLCTNIYESEPNFYDDINSNYLEEKNLKPFGHDHHSTMIFESNKIKIGFMALADECAYKELKEKIDNDLENILDSTSQTKIEYMDYLSEANKASQQLRLCGANVIVALTIMNDSKSIERLFNESNDLDIIICVNDDQQSSLAYDSAVNLSEKRQAKRWLLRNGLGDESFINYLSMISLRVNPTNVNQIIDISITKYNI